MLLFNLKVLLSQWKRAMLL